MMIIILWWCNVIFILACDSPCQAISFLEFRSSQAHPVQTALHLLVTCSRHAKFGNPGFRTHEFIDWDQHTEYIITIEFFGLTPSDQLRNSRGLASMEIKTRIIVVASVSTEKKGGMLEWSRLYTWHIHADIHPMTQGTSEYCRLTGRVQVQWYLSQSLFRVKAASIVTCYRCH